MCYIRTSTQEKQRWVKKGRGVWHRLRGTQPGYYWTVCGTIYNTNDAAVTQSPEGRICTRCNNRRQR